MTTTIRTVLFPFCCCFWLLYWYLVVFMLSDTFPAFISTRAQTTLLLVFSVLLPLSYVCLWFSFPSVPFLSLPFFLQMQSSSSPPLSIYFLDVFGMLLASKNLEVVFLPPTVPSSPQKYVPLFIKTSSSMILSVDTVTFNNIYCEFRSKKLVLLRCYS